MKELYFNYYWDKIPDSLLPRAVREFVDSGVTHLAITEEMLHRFIHEPAYLALVKQISALQGVTFGAPHGLAGRPWDLNEPYERKKMLSEHKAALDVCGGEFGVRTYTVHPGAWWHCIGHLDVDMLRENTIRTLEELLPVAEKNRIIIAVENSFEPTNSAKEICAIADHFGGHPWLGLNYDTGHANCMASAPWKVPSGYPDYQYTSWWQNGIITEDGALEKMAARVVTCHIHDNDGYRDLHAMPGDGTIDWDDLLPRLKACPNMIEYQTELNFDDGEGWAGISPAPAGGYSIRRLVDVFRNKLGFDK